MKMKFMRFVINIDINFEKRLHIIYLIVQKLSNELGKLSSCNPKHGQNKFRIW
jgi:hypothetical protein